MDDPGQHPCIRVRRRNVRVVNENRDKIRELFAVRLSRKTSPPRQRAPQQLHHDVSKSTYVYLSVEPDKCAPPGVSLSDVAPHLQMFVDSLCGGGGGAGGGAASAAAVAAAEAAGDDSSYDSDYEDKEEAEHADVSRTVSDTLGAEFAEYVSRAGAGTGTGTGAPAAHPALSPSASVASFTQQQGYAARVEFGLKLGYTERLVQAALAKLGPSPGQNELLEELIRLGARATAAAVAGGGAPAAGAVTPAGGGAAPGVAGAGAEAPAADTEALALAESLAAATLAAQEAEEAAAAAAGPLTSPAPAQLRHIVIDGSNVAMSHGNKEVFSCRGIRICVDWFRARGHRDITVFVPKWRKEASRPDNPVTEQEILTELERERLLVFTPSKLVGGKRIVCYDDRYVLRLAAETDGIVVSNDNYRDLAQESPEFRRVVEERILMYSFVNDRFMPPDDPLGRAGPTLEHFLRCPAGGSGAGAGAGAGGAATGAGAGAAPRRPGEPPPQLCPYGKKCTYGNKCKYQHPERGPLPQKTVTEKLAEHHKQQMQARGQAAAVAAAVAAGNPATKSMSLPLPGCVEDKAPRKTPLSRTRSNAPGLHPPPAPMALSDHGEPPCGGVSKSRSVENIGGAPALPPPQGYGLWARADPALAPPSAGAWCQPPPPHRGLVFGDQSGHVAVAQRLSDPESAPPGGDGVNLHRKLQRQLTLNPACDPRLQQLRAAAPQHHRPSARMASGPDSFAWEALSRPPPPLPQHQHVTRNASAPDSFLPAAVWNPPAHAGAAAPPAVGRNMFRHGSTSDPQINLCVEPSGDPFDVTVWPQQQPAPQQGPLVWGPPPPASTEEARRMMHYHLSALFPPEQVQQAMRMFPEETSAQKICAAILAMFPVKP